MWYCDSHLTPPQFDNYLKNMYFLSQDFSFKKIATVKWIYMEQKEKKKKKIAKIEA